MNVAADKDKTTENNTCTLCSGKDFRVLFDRDFRVLLCTDCCCIFIPEEDYKTGEFYVHDYPIRLAGLKAAFNKTQNTSIKRHIKWISRFIPDLNNAAILEIGCGTASLLNALQNRGVHVHGIEPGIKAALVADSLVGRENITCGMLEDAKVEAEYDAVLLIHVFDHLEDPIFCLQKIRSFLKPQGLLFIVVPNFFTLHGLFRLPHYTYSYPSPNHIFVYTPRTLESALQKAGFEKIAARSFLANIRMVARTSSAPGPGIKESLTRVRIFYLFSNGVARTKHFFYKAAVFFKLRENEPLMVMKKKNGDRKV